MGNESNVIKLTASGTTTLGSVLLFGVSVNKTLTGTLTVNENGTAVGQFAIGTTPGTYHHIPNGVRYTALTLVLSAGDDCTAFTKVA
jgi:hypothetical protein